MKIQKRLIDDNHRLYYNILTEFIQKGDAMECKHDWKNIEDNCWVCRNCGATKRIAFNGIIRCYDADGNRIPTDGNVSMREIHRIEQELKKK